MQDINNKLHKEKNNVTSHYDSLLSSRKKAVLEQNTNSNHEH